METVDQIESAGEADIVEQTESSGQIEAQIEIAEPIEALMLQTEDVLSDLLLSGFQGVHSATLDQIDSLVKTYEDYGMHTGMNLLLQLKSNLLRRKNSFDYDIDSIMQSYTQLEFYIQRNSTY